MQDILASTSLKGNIGHPLGPFLLYYFMYSLCKRIIISKWCRLWSNVGKGEGKRNAKRCWIYDVEVKKLPHDFQNYYYIAYKNK